MGYSENVQEIQAAGGFVPVAGRAGGKQQAGNRWESASVSAAAAVPCIGDPAPLKEKPAGGGVKTAGQATAKMAGLNASFGMSKGKAKTGAGKASGQGLNDVKNDGKKRCLNGRCFTADTLIYTKYGYRPIKEIQAGDEVYSKDIHSGEVGLKKVTEICRTQAHTIYHIWLDESEEIKMTAYHPLFIREKGWVNAINLQKYDVAATMEGTAKITKIAKERLEQAEMVYNFHVEEWASYFVANCRLYVHNGEERHIEDDKGLDQIEDNRVRENVSQVDCKVVGTYSAEEVNATFPSNYEPPYKEGTQVVEIELNKDTTFSRVYHQNPDGSNNMKGNWSMNESEIKGLSPDQIQDKFSVPKQPDSICDQNVPAGTRMRVGEAAGVGEYGTKGGGIQFDLKGNRSTGTTYTNGRPLR